MNNANIFKRNIWVLKLCPFTSELGVQNPIQDNSRKCAPRGGGDISLTFSVAQDLSETFILKLVLTIVAKKWEPGNLVPSRFSGQIRKVEARLGNLAKIRKVVTNLENSSKRSGKLKVRPKKRKDERSLPNFGWEIRKIEPNKESSLGKSGKFVAN